MPAARGGHAEDAPIYRGVRRNLRQEVSRPRGAGRQPRERRIRRTVDSPTSRPRRTTSPCTRRYPQAGFFPASRNTTLAALADLYRTGAVSLESGRVGCRGESK